MPPPEKLSTAWECKRDTIETGLPVTSLRAVIVKPSKYDEDGFVERFRRGFMPNTTVPYLASMTPPEVAGSRCEVHAVDE